MKSNKTLKCYVILIFRILLLALILMTLKIICHLLCFLSWYNFLIKVLFSADSQTLMQFSQFFFFFFRISAVQPYKHYWSRGIYLAQNHLYSKSPCPLPSPEIMSIWRRSSNCKRLCALFLMGAERGEVKSQSQTWMDMDPYGSILSNVKVPKSYTNTQFNYC